MGVNITLFKAGDIAIDPGTGSRLINKVIGV